MKGLLTMVLTVGMTVLVSSQALATGTIRDNWLGFYPDVCQRLIDAANDCSLCHLSGLALNPYAQDLVGVSDYTTIENLDSDGDTVNNGQEINVDCTFPGDGDDVPTDESTWAQIKGHYR